MFRFRRQPPVEQVRHTKEEYIAAHAALVAKVLPLYKQIKDPAQQVMFVVAMENPHGPKPFSDSDQGEGLQIIDFPGMTIGLFNAIETGVFNPADGSVVDAGGNLRAAPGAPGVMPYGDLLKLVVQAQAMHGA